MTYDLTPLEILGYVGGVMFSVALIPQLSHTFRTKSTADISYAWQGCYVTGLTLNIIYFILNDAVAAWTTHSVELFFAVLLLVLKFRNDGFGPCRRQSPNQKASMEQEESSSDVECGGKACGDDTTPCSENSEEELAEQGHRAVEEDVNFILFSGEKKGSATENVDRNTPNTFPGLHIMFDVVVEKELLQANDYGSTLVGELKRLALIHQIPIAHEHMEIFGGGFHSVMTLMPCGHISAHLDYSPQQSRLCVNMFTTCGVGEELKKLSCMARDVQAFLKATLAVNDEGKVGETNVASSTTATNTGMAKFNVYTLSQFPESFE